MNYTENFEGISLDVQSVGFTPDARVEERIRKMLSYLTRFSSGKIVYAAIFLENKEDKSTKRKSVKVQLEVPGPDMIASDTGDDFVALIGSVEDMLARKLKR